ncbi:EVE domain-containing protein [Prochlorococcus sp. MIT 1300]|uniref:EVE domain-containing protein n=1 Tax=Prochlorococcus sp. MIT 1300 TaxID=3096218 RepID=UPI002A760736|nr:EVE domain-containing protein [Prochlorococcus sp. MIT 1300]
MTDINYWLMKSEPDVYGINTLHMEKETLWDGIRNYQARNFMRSMEIGDKAFFYHSNCKPPEIVGLMEVIQKSQTDPTQFDKQSKYYDPKSSPENPRWDCVKLRYLCHAQIRISLNELKEIYSPEQLGILKKGNRLSIIPVPKVTALDLIHRLKIKI